MYPTFQFGSVAINVSGLILVFCMWVGLTRSEDFGFKSGYAPARIFNLCLFIIAGGVIGARLIYAARYSSAFLANPGSLISPNPLMFDIYGALLGSIIGFLFYMRKHKLPFLKSLDMLTPFLLVSVIGIGFSHLSSGYAYGSPTDLPWGIVLWGNARHPTQIIEILLAGISAFLLWPSNPWISVSFLKTPGVRFLSFFVLAAFSRLLIEPLRGDPAIAIGAIRSPQLIAFVIMLTALGIIAYLIRTQEGSKQEN